MEAETRSSVTTVVTLPVGAPRARRLPPPADAALDGFVRNRRPALTRLVARHLRRSGCRADQELTEELVQETLCRFLERLSGPVAPEWAAAPHRLAAYLDKIAVSVVSDRLRSLHALKRGSGRVGQMSIEEERWLQETRADPAPSPEERLLAREGLRRALARLRVLEPGTEGAHRLQLLLWAAVAEMTSREIAARLAGRASAAGVDSLLHRLRRRLRRGWEEN